MKNYDTYYMILTPEQKKKVIDIARLIPSITIGKAAEIFVQCGGNEAAFKRYLHQHYGIVFKGDVERKRFDWREVTYGGDRK